MKNAETKPEIARLIEESEYLWQEKDWRVIRRFFAGLEENVAAAQPEEIEYCLYHCYEMFFHRKGAVRRMAGHITGVLLSSLGEELPRVWEDLLHRILFPNHKLGEQKTQWLTYSLMHVVSTAAGRLTGEAKKQFLMIYFRYFRSARWGSMACLNLLGGILEIRPEDWTPLQKHEIFGFMRYLFSTNPDCTLISLMLLKTWRDRGWEPQQDEQRYLEQLCREEKGGYARNYLLRKITGIASASQEDVSITELMQQNLRADEDWVEKLVNMDIIRERLKETGSEEEREAARAAYAAHLMTLFRLSEHPMIFLKAASDLIGILPMLKPQKVYDILQEALKEISMGVDSSNSIAQILGSGFFLLRDEDQQEFVDKLDQLTDNDNPTTEMTVLEAICLICTSLVRVGSAETHFDRRQLPRLLTAGLYSSRPQVADETAFLVKYHGLEDLVKPSLLQPAGSGSGGKIAFFSASFDPFTIRDFAIAKELQEMGFRICFAIHDFDWQKVTQPYHIRRKLLEMSVSGLENAELLPEDISVHFDNRDDLEHLRALYPGQEVWLVRENTELEKISDAAAAFPHIIYSDLETGSYMDRTAIGKIIRGKVILLRLPARYQGITAEAVHSRIGQGREIAGFVERHAERTIREWGLYEGRPTFKKQAHPRELNVFFSEGSVTVRSADYSGYVFWKKAGKTAVLTQIYGDITPYEDYRGLALLELFLQLQQQDYAHIVCFNAKEYGSLLRPFGFLPMEEYEEGMTVDLSRVVVLFLDALSFINEPYRQDPALIRAICRNQENIRLAAAKLYPGKLLLSLPADIINARLIRLIHENCGGSGAEEGSAQGGCICVPFGKILKEANIPGVITMELNTEKKYRADLSSFEVCEFPEYRSLKAQTAVLNSMARPLVLVDDLFHNGYRYEKASEYMKKAGIEIRSLQVGILSGRGEQLAKELNIPVQAVYRVPNMTVWLLESDLYPFMGGDGIETEVPSERREGALASVNTILPYQLPGFIRQAGSAAFYQLSKTALTNAHRLFCCLEELYREKQRHVLTLAHLQEVMAEPRFPAGILQEGDDQRRISELLLREETRLSRLHM